ncbi:Alpha/beta-Hydrolases superfamily protein [Theobroma cacao]|uniref:Alpha/beta-Hydrolases superfamily protein n=1 Tax=Theobroma cacao TaxID=3641 RepID=A0A061FR99_THECC|nr:Alpha/beta-Hydrolases superfamily protein [Theobroma cacao]
MAEAVPPHEEFIEGVATRDVTSDSDSSLKVRIHLLEQSLTTKTKLPIILHFHGGGFCISQADWYMYYIIYTRLARSVPAICVSVYLRLAPENKLPAACDDGYATLLWLKSLAKGGNIMHQVAARAGNLDLSPLRLAGGIPIHPGFVRAERSKLELEQPESPFLTLDMVDKFLALALPVGSTKDHPITCPMGPAAPAMEGLNLPPFLFCVAENDLIKDTEMEYYEAMKS